LVGIRPFAEQSFAREHVTIDFAGFSGETLHGVIQESLDNIRIGRIKPASVTIRMLLPDGKDAVVFHHSAHSGQPADLPLHRADPHLVHLHVEHRQLRVPVEDDGGDQDTTP
jgi:hypothetical protein